MTMIRRSKARRWLALLVCLFILFTLPLVAKQHRSTSARREFQKQHPCPSTGKKTGPCPGYVRDHVIPLACGGVDAPSNLQWQSIADAKAKDKVERRGCGKKGGKR